MARKTNRINCFVYSLSVLAGRISWYLSDRDDACYTFRAQDKVCVFIPIMPISSLNPIFDNLLESSHRDDSEIGQHRVY